MLPPLLHQFQINARSLRSAAIMKMLVIHIPLIIALCCSLPNVSGKPLTVDDDEDEDVQESAATTVTTTTTTTTTISQLDDTVKLEDGTKAEDRMRDKMPILPPIILLDFANDTENGNTSYEEKSKRTVDSGLGYGLNNVQTKRYNYYFPAGKSGTTVSIEESISPFLPKTIIERVPDNHQTDPQKTSHQINALRHNSFATSTTFSEINSQRSGHNFAYLNVHRSAKPQPVFGLRTKPQNTNENYQSFFTTAKPASLSSLGIQNSGYTRDNGAATTARYVTPSPANFARNQFTYATQDPPLFRSGETYVGRQNHVQSDSINSHGFAQNAASSSTASPFAYNPSSFQQQNEGSSVQPKYTVENGVRYENKVFWKYPDGRVSDVPPATYVETTYPREYPRESEEPVKSQDSRSIYENGERAAENSVLSQGPVQFPSISEETGREPNPYISAESLSTSLPQQQVYRLSYQNLVSQRSQIAQRHKANAAPSSYSLSSSSSSSSSSLAKSKPSRRPDSKSYRQNLSRYMVDSPNPEYTSGYTTEASVTNATTPFFASSSNSVTSVTSKYVPSKVQGYLDKVLNEESRQSFDNNDLSSYSNLRYSDLLNYNPSISEYIRNPSSILNVRPTFVQAGNSLIPVIILRVDGASPIQTKATENINLKALLQRYLVQYAKSIQQLAEPSTYNFGTTERSLAKRPTFDGFEKNRALDPIRLTEDDARHSSTYNSYVGKSSYETSNLQESKNFVNGRYVEGSRGRQKMKNVEIIDDPRFARLRN
ncbi:uncharacterized protein LOC105736164 [Apis florea]|uniref:uncharacterized protein LOC105736164 n=1 Tax=Apis florea TaxID=7463 RepID=UPI0006298348|nr:uncharacterized protein LOC105736164 [Apis florea]